MSFYPHKRLSCGIVILNPDRELLLCHVTGQNHWDLPKGGIDIGETPMQAALRETREECGLRLDADVLLDLGRFRYTSKKDLHLFAAATPRIALNEFRCESHYHDRPSGRQLPEMDGFGWFAFERTQSLCTPKMAAVLGQRMALDALFERLMAPRELQAAAA